MSMDKKVVGASLSEPHVDQKASPANYLSIYLCTCSAQTVDLDHPWIVLRKVWIGRYPQFAQDNPWIAPFFPIQLLALQCTE